MRIVNSHSEYQINNIHTENVKFYEAKQVQYLYTSRQADNGAGVSTTNDLNNASEYDTSKARTFGLAKRAERHPHERVR